MICKSINPDFIPNRNKEHIRWRNWDILNTYHFFFSWYSFNLHLWIAGWTVFIDRDFWKFSWVHAVMSSRDSCLFLMRLRARRSHASSPDLRPCSMCTDTLDSLDLLMILWTVDGEIFKVSHSTANWNHNIIHKVDNVQKVGYLYG